MKNIGILVFLLLNLSVFAQNAGAPGSAACPVQFAQLSPDLKQEADLRAAGIRKVFKVVPLSRFQKFTKEQIVVLRHNLQVINEHPFPAMAMTDMVRTYGWAKAAFKTLNPEEAALIGVDEVFASIEKNVDQVLKYETDVEEMVSKSANLLIEYRTLQKALSDLDLQVKKGDLIAEIPVYDVKTGQVIGVNQYEAESPAALAIRLKKRNLRSKALEEDFLPLPVQLQNVSIEANARAYQQAVMIKQLESARSLLRHFMSENENVPLPKRYQDLLVKIESVFADVETGKVKEALSPPTWAWMKLKRVQLSEEFKSFFAVLGQLPKAKTFEEAKRILNLIKKLSPEERQFLGIQKVPEFLAKEHSNRFLKAMSKVYFDAASGRYSKWILGFGTMTGVGAGASQVDWQDKFTVIFGEITRDRREKQECVSKASDKDYVACVDAYIRRRFNAVEALSPEDKLALVKNGKLQNTKISKILEDIVQRRDEYLESQNMADSLSAVIEHTLEHANLNSAIFVERMVTTKEHEDFRKFLVGSGSNSKGYLERRHAAAWTQTRARQLAEFLIDEIKKPLLDPANAEGENALITPNGLFDPTPATPPKKELVTRKEESSKLVEKAYKELESLLGGEDLAKDLQSILEARKNYLLVQAEDEKLSKELDEKLKLRSSKRVTE